MNFSSALASRTGCVVSSCGEMLVTSSPPRISVWSSKSARLLAVFPIPELSQVDRLEVSPDSELVLAAGFKAGWSARAPSLTTGCYASSLIP